MASDPQDHEVQQQQNAAQIEQLFRVYFPNFPLFSVPLVEIIKIMAYLEQTGVNPEILPRVIRGVENIHLGSGEGEVIIHVRKNVTTLETREREKDQFDTKKAK